jgi:hypothetical protein
LAESGPSGFVGRKCGNCYSYRFRHIRVIREQLISKRSKCVPMIMSDTSVATSGGPAMPPLSARMATSRTRHKRCRRRIRATRRRESRMGYSMMSKRGAVLLSAKRLRQLVTLRTFAVEFRCSMPRSAESSCPRSLEASCRGQWCNATRNRRRAADWPRAPHNAVVVRACRIRGGGRRARSGYRRRCPR